MATMTKKAWMAVLIVMSTSMHSVMSMMTTCGGFVSLGSKLSASRNKQKVDFDRVQLKLYKLHAESEHLKETVKCSPNGYYIVPVYDDGNYVLRIQGPEGWRFAPSETRFLVNNENKACEGDVNFEIAGFRLQGSLSGSMLPTCNDKTFSTALSMSLWSSDEETLLDTVESTSEGTFVFDSVAPGSYVMSALHESQSVTPEKLSCSMEWGGTDLGSVFILSGSTVSGTIASDGSAPGAQVFLIADVPDSDSSIVGCTRARDTSLIPESYSLQKKTVCVSTTDESGKFQFDHVPCGKYLFVPVYQKVSADGSNSITFDVVPKEFSASIGFGASALGSVFRIAGISVRGHISHTSGAGVKDAQVLVDDKPKAITDANGYYRLKELSFGKYVIRVYKEGMTFQELPAFTVSEHSAPVPDIKALLYRFCGRADNGGVNYARRIEATGEDGVTLSTETDSDGQYCFDVQPGKYTVEPIISASERKNKSVLSPKMRDVVIVDEPVVGIDFSQVMVSISGTVTCLKSTCDSSLRVEMQSESTSGAVIAPINIKDSTFSIGEVAPGEYSLHVSMDDACFEKSSQKISVELEDVSNIKFAQTGVLVSTVSSLATDISVRRAGGKEAKDARTVRIQEGKDSFCVPSFGLWTIEPISCFRCAQQVYEIDVETTNELVFEAVEFRVSGSIEIAANTGFKSSDSISVSIVNTKNDADEFVVPATFVRSDSNQPLVFSYEFFGRDGDAFQISASTPSNTAVIISPSSRMVSIDSRSCPGLVPAFEGRQAVFRQGTVSPPVPNAEVVVTLAGDDEIMFSASVDEDGSYRVGPLSETETYSLKVRANGYHFVEESAGHFRSVRLGEIDVTIADEQGNPIPFVLVSLSGHGFRSNSQTDGKGHFRFGNLFPDQYYLFPLLKEYEFTPPSQMVNVVEGKVVEQNFVAVRNAYSVFGSVTSLNGEPESGVVLHAQGENGEHEETSTDASGEYRMRGLLPNLRYTLSVQCGGAKDTMVRSSPKSRELVITPEDQTGIDFIVFRRLSHFDVTGSIAFEGDWIHSFEVEIANANNVGTVLRHQTLSPEFRFFQFPRMPAGRYIIRASAIAATGGSQNLVRRAESSADNRGHHEHVVLEFATGAGDEDEDQLGRSSFLTLIIGFAIMMGVLNHEQLLAKFEAIKYRPNPGKPSDWVPKSKQLSRKGSRKVRR